MGNVWVGKLAVMKVRPKGMMMVETMVVDWVASLDVMMAVTWDYRWVGLTGKTMDGLKG